MFKTQAGPGPDRAWSRTGLGQTGPGPVFDQAGPGPGRVWGGGKWGPERTAVQAGPGPVFIN